MLNKRGPKIEPKIEPILPSCIDSSLLPPSNFEEPPPLHPMFSTSVGNPGNGRSQ